MTKTFQGHRRRYRRLRGALLAAGITHGDLARLLHLSHSSMSNRFCGKQPWRSDEMYATLCYLGIPNPETVLGLYFPPSGLSSDKEGDLW